MNFYKTFEIPPKLCVAIVGAGGKTTLMYRLAAEMVPEAEIADGVVLIASTTKIFRPEPDEADVVILSENLQEAQKQIKKMAQGGLRIVLGTGSHNDPRYDTSKLDGIPPQWAGSLLEMEEVSWLLIEADGSQRKPVKAPGPREPVWPNPTHWTIGVLGLSALGHKNYRDRVFRPECVSKVTNVPQGTILELSTYLSLLTNSDGIFRDAPKESRLIGFLNQSDTCDQVVDHNTVGYIIDREVNPGRLESVFLGSLIDTKIQRVWAREG